MTVRTGFSSLGAQSLDTALRQAAEHDFDFVELTMNDFPADQLTADAESIRETARSDGTDLIVHLPFGDGVAAVGSSDKRARETALEELTESVKAAGRVGAEKAVLHIETRGAPHLLETGDTDELVAALGELTAVGADQNVEICAENMTQRLPRLEELTELFDRTDIAVTVDTGHARTNGRPDGRIAAFADEYADAISHFHLNDTWGASDDHLPFGAGTVDFERILGRLPSGWEGTLTLEINTRDYDYIAFSGQKLSTVLERALP